MNTTISRDVKRNIKYTMYQRGSLHTPGSIGWYVEDLSRCLHPLYKSFNDVKNAIFETDIVIDGVYNRAETGQKKKRKIGTGKAKYIKGQRIVKVSRDAKTNSNEVLNTDDFIPCVDHTAALVLEAALQRTLGKRERVIGAVKDKIQIKVHRWEAPAIADDGEKGGYEVFNFEDIWEDSVSVVRDELRNITSTVSVGRSSPNSRYYQVDAKSLLAEFCINGGSSRDFYLLMKPRSGKNITCILGLVDVAEEYFNRTGNPLRVLLLSLWPSAFAGLGNDVRDYRFNIDVGFVNTQNNTNWEQELVHAESINQLVFVTASLQSLDAELAKRLKDNPNLLDQLELEVENYDPSKHEKLKLAGFPIAVFDECDHGLRTDNSKSIIESFGFTKCIWMSGSDLYALRNDAIAGVNAYVYDFIQEIKDVKSSKIEKRPLPVFLTFRPETLPFENEVAVEDMNVEGVSRRLRVVQQTTVDIKCEQANDRKYSSKIRSYKLNNSGFWVDSEGDLIRAVNHQQFRSMLETALSYDDAIKTKNYVSPNDLIANDRPANVFAMSCSVAGQLAMFNELKLMNCGWIPVSTKEFVGSNNIERDINDRINALNSKGFRTITVTTRQLLRGAKANWDGVIRFDDLSDFKIGLQACLRGQNTTNDYFYVWDLNLFRCSKMNVEVIRSGTKGENLNTSVRECKDLLPCYVKDSNSIRATRLDTDELIELWQRSDGISEGLAQDNNYDTIGLLSNASILENVGKNKPAEDKRDDRAGSVMNPGEKSPKKPPANVIIDPTKQQIKELKAKAKTVGRQLSVLLYLMINQGHIYDEIDPLLNNCPSDLFRDWLEHVGIYNDLSHKDIKTQLAGLFVKERINHQLFMLRQRFESGNFSPKNWNELTQLDKSDVFTEEEKIREMYLRYGGSKFWNTHPTVFDPGCGRGEFLVVWAQLLQEHGCNDISNKIYWADLSPINVRLVSARLNIDISNGFVYTASKDGGTAMSFNKGLSRMKINADKVHIVGNLPFTSGQGKAPVAIPIMLALLDKGTPESINLVQDIGFLSSAAAPAPEFRKALFNAGLKEITFNDQSLFKDSDATVWTADLFCQKGYTGKVSVTSLKGNKYKYDYRKTDIIVEGGSEELTDFLYNQLSLTKGHGVLLCHQEKTGLTVNRKGEVSVDINSISDTLQDGFVPFLYKMSKSGNVIKYINKKCVKESKDHDSYRIVMGYLPSGESHSLSIGLTTIIPPGVYLPDSPNRYFIAEDKGHAESLNNYIQSNPVDKFILQTTRKNKTFDAKTVDGVTKFVPKLPAGVKIETDDDVFEFFKTPVNIREAVRANYRY